MLELDVWLTSFLDVRYSDLPAVQQSVFFQLLQQDDLKLFDWITGECAPPAEFLALVDEIKIIRYLGEKR